MEDRQRKDSICFIGDPEKKKIGQKCILKTLIQ